MAAGVVAELEVFVLRDSTAPRADLPIPLDSLSDVRLARALAMLRHLRSLPRGTWIHFRTGDDALTVALEDLEDAKLVVIEYRAMRRGIDSRARLVRPAFQKG